MTYHPNHHPHPHPHPLTPTPTPHAMLLAAGRGQRMMPLTAHCPKPLLKVKEQSLLVHHLHHLYRDGIYQWIINTAWQGHHVAPHVALHQTDWQQAHITYSHEQTDFGFALETAGGVVRALPHLNQLFWVIAADIYAPEFDFMPPQIESFWSSDDLAYLWLVPNPAQHPQGDFSLNDKGRVHLETNHERYTYSAMGLYKADLFTLPWTSIPKGNPKGVVAPLAPLLYAAIQAGRVGGCLYQGTWVDVGTPERLAQINAA